MSQNFDKIGKNYDKLTSTMGYYNNWMLKNILERTNLTSNDFFIYLAFIKFYVIFYYNIKFKKT